MYRSFYHTQQSIIKNPNQICFNIFVWYINANNEYMWVVHSIVTVFFPVIILTRIYAFLFKNFMNFSKHQKQHFRHLEGNRKITVRYIYWYIEVSTTEDQRRITPANIQLLQTLISELIQECLTWGRTWLICFRSLSAYGPDIPEQLLSSGLWLWSMIQTPMIQSGIWKKNPTNCFKNRKHTCNNKAAKQCKRLYMYQKIS